MKWNAIFECTSGQHMLNLITNLKNAHHKLQLVTLLCVLPPVHLFSVYGKIHL